MRCIARVLAIILLIAPLLSTAYPRINSGIDAYEEGDFALASQLWNSDAEAIEEIGNSKYDQRVSALAYVLASMAAAKAGQAATYELWGNANRIYAELGTNWEAEANQFRDYLAEIDSSAAAFADQEGNGSLTRDRSDEQLISLQRTGIFNYERPPTGLTDLPALPEDTGEVKLGAEPFPAQTVSRVANRTPNIDQTFADATTIGPEANGSSRRIASKGSSRPAETKVAPLNNEDIVAQQRQIEGNAIGNRGNVRFTVELSEQQRLWAETAWQYYRNAIQSTTGLADTHPGHAFTSVWGIANQIAATISANQLGVLTDIGANDRINLLLITLSKLPLYQDKLPNRSYTTDTAEMISANGKPNPIGGGWSAVDIGRLLIWLKILVEYYPSFNDPVQALIEKWDLNAAISASGLIGALQNAKESKTFQEGRFGYEHYAAKGFELWGIDVPGALDYENTKTVTILDTDLLIDDRNNSPSNGYPFLLIALELGSWDKVVNAAIRHTSTIQRAYWEDTGDLVALSGYHLDKEPWYGFGTFANGQAGWRSITTDGRQLKNELSSVFTAKSAFVLSGLTQAEHSKHLRTQAHRLLRPDVGFHEGIYDDGSLNKTISADTQAAILESLWFAHRSKVPFLATDEQAFVLTEPGDSTQRPAFSVTRF